MKLEAEWISELRRYDIGDLQIADVRIGVFYTAVEISTGQVGLAFTPRDLNDAVCCPRTAAAAPPAGRMAGSDAWVAADYALSPSELRRAVGIAALNAISAAAIDRYGLPEGALHENLDALDAAAIAPDDEVVMVGAFVPFIKKLKGSVTSIKVIDKHRDALKSDEQSMWVPPERAREALRRASVAILTGSTLVEGGLEELLSFTDAARVRVMAGPTTPMWPQPFFRRGIDVLGGVRVVDGKDLLAIVSQGGSGYFFERAVRKVCVVNESHLASRNPRERADPGLK
jgi:uncharacterized protein (DUF4213/DUF364 family)